MHRAYLWRSYSNIINIVHCVFTPAVVNSCIKYYLIRHPYQRLDHHLLVVVAVEASDDGMWLV